MADPDATPARRDVVNAYRLALGRDPESEAVIEDRLGQPNRVWLPPFFRSDEFVAAVVDPVARGEPLGGAWFGLPLPRDLARWAADFVPLDEAGRAAAREAEDWHALFAALFGDAAFTRAIISADGEAGDGEAADPAFLAALAARCRLAASATVRGAIEGVTDGELRGWAIDLRAPGRPPALELRINGRFAGATTPDLPRPDLDHPGRPGFVLRFAAPRTEGPAPVVELRDVASGTVIGSVRLPGSRAPAIDAIAETRRELAALRAILARIEARLPDIHRETGFPLAAWDAYAATYYPERHDPELGARDPAPADVIAILAAKTWPMAALDAALESLFAQSARPRTIIVDHDAGDLRIEAELLLDRWRGRFGASATILGGSGAPLETRRLLLCTAPGRLAPDAVTLLLAALDRGALLAYADDDAIADGDGARRADPRLRSAFDADLLLQQDCLGPMAALVLDRDDMPAGPASIVARALQLCARGERNRIAHVPRVLFHRIAGAPHPQGHHDAVRAFLAREAPDVAVSAHHDRLGARLPDALSIARAPPPGTRVAIIVPTRDRLDLIEPCLGSIARSLAHSRVAVEVVVVDNRGTDEAVRRFLADYRGIERLRTIAYDGAFNWAAINNHAAAGIDADVLVFLNNDTVVLAPECWDVLAAQAMRPSVGAVGARLLYRDGTIQHAGMVTDPWHSFAVHEGVGDAGDDPGYLGRHALVRQVSAVTGACLATRAALFRDVGGFDAVAFPFEGNDSDYCLRLRDRGYDVLYEPGATLYHFESRTRGYNDDDAKRRRAAQATAELRARWAATFAQDRFYNPHFDRLAPPCTRLAPPPVPVRSPDGSQSPTS